MKTLHIKYKNLLHIHPFNSSLYITRSSCQSNSLYLTSSRTRLWQQQAEMSPSLPKGKWCLYRAGATRAQIHKVTSIFFLPLQRTRGKDGRGEHCFGSRQSSFTGSCEWDTNILEKLLLFLTKNTTLYYFHCSDFQLPNFRSLLVTYQYTCEALSSALISRIRGSVIRLSKSDACMTSSTKEFQVKNNKNQ